MKAILKLVYNLIPLKKQFYSVLKLFWQPRESIYQHLHFKGVFSVPLRNGKKFKIYHPGFIIENTIFWKGLEDGWEKQSIKLWLKLSEDSETILDIGANTGIYALVAKAVNPKAKVYAFEPHPMFCKLLRRNISINQTSIAAVEKAVSNRDGVITIEDYSGETPTIYTDACTLDAFIEEHDIKKIDLIKIDVELHEPEVLEGFSKYLSLHKPTMIIEILGEEIASSVYSTVKDLGYLYFNIDEDGEVRQTEKIEKSDYFNYLLCSREKAGSLGLLEKKPQSGNKLR